MKHSVKLSSVGVALCVAPTLLAQAEGSPQFNGMGTPNGFSGYLQIQAMTDAGEAFGWIWEPALNRAVATGWSPTEGYFFLPPAPGQSSGVNACTPDGSKIFGGYALANGTGGICVWTDRTTMPALIPGQPDPKVLSCGIYATNHDGTVLVGTTLDTKTLKPGIFIWRAGVRKNQGWEFITQWPQGVADAAILDLDDAGRRGYGGSSDATISSFQGVRWDWKAGFTLLGDAPGGPIESWLGSCSWDGSVGGGYTRPDGPSVIASRYVHGLGWQVLGTVKPTHNGSGGTIDKSGHVMVGYSWKWPNNQDQTGFVWNIRDGMRDVKDILVSDYGLTAATNWTLTGVAEISHNGRYIAGIGKNPQGQNETWWAEIRPFCYADCDTTSTPKGGEAVLNIDDFICYMTHFVMDGLYANCNNDAELNIDDFICFQTAFSLGC